MAMLNNQRVTNGICTNGTAPLLVPQGRSPEPELICPIYHLVKMVSWSIRPVTVVTPLEKHPNS
jgi:hypothetical protein